jgi:hypothetical protein
MNKKDDAGSSGAASPAPAPSSSPEPTVSGRFDMEAGQGYINNKPVSLEEYQAFSNMSSAEKAQTYGMRYGGIVPSYAEGGGADFKNLKRDKGEKEGKESLLSKLFGMTPTGMALKGVLSFGSSVKEKGFGNAALDFAGGAFGNLKGFMDEKGITDVLMMHPLAKMGAFGFEKGKEAFGNLKGFMDDKGITDTLMMHPLAKMGAFGLDKFMNFGKDPARDITGQSGQDIKGAGVDTQLISARPGDFVVNKKTATAMGPDYFDNISSATGEKITGAGPDSQMIAVRPGEIVVNRETVDAVGADHFLGLNKLFGGSGANKPKMAEVQAASGGGFVLPAFSSGGMVHGGENPSTGDGSKTGGLPVVSVSHPNTGSGFGVEGVTDYKGRPGVFSKGAAEAFAKMITDSGGAVKGSDIASSQRSKSYNAHVGGVSNSNHLYGNALDIHGTSQTWMRANGQKYGWIVNDYPGSHGGHFNYKGAGADQMNTPDEGSPVATGQGGRPLGSTTQRAGTGLRSGGPGGPSKSSVVLALKNGVQGKLDTATGKFTPAEFTKAERARYTKFGGTIPETKAKPQNKLLGTLTGAAAGAAVGAMLGGPLGALIGGVAGGVLGSGILSGGESDPNKPKRSSFPRGRAGTKRYSEAMKKYKAQKQQAAEKKKASDANKPKRSDFPMGRAGGKAYSEALKKHQSGDSTTAQPASSSPEATKRHAELMKTTDPSAQKRIADYDAKHGKGAYSKMLKKKLNKIYSTKKGPDMKISGPALGRLAMGALGGAALGPMGMMGGMMGGALLSGMNIKDGNIGKPTAQEQKDFDTLAASKEKLRQSEARLAKMNPSISMPGPPSGGGNNVKVVRMPSPGGGDNPNDKNTGGSDVDAAQTGNGNKAKWNILGIPMPF